MKTLILIKDEFVNPETGIKVPTIAIAIDGAVKQAFDIISEKKGLNYEEIVRDVFFSGMQKMFDDIKTENNNIN